MNEYNIKEFKREVDGLYRIVSEEMGKLLDNLHGQHGHKFWIRFNGYGLYRFCYIFVNEYKNNEVKLPNKEYLTFDAIRSDYEFEGRPSDFELNYTYRNRIILYFQRFVFSIFRPKFLTWRVYMSRRYLIIQVLKSKLKHLPVQLRLKLNKETSKYDRTLRSEIFNDEFCEKICNEKKRKHLAQFFINYYPTICIERFKEVKSDVLKRYAFLSDSKLIVNESFSSDHEASIILSLLNDTYALEHCYNEHNKLTHIFQYNTLDIISSLVDRYYTIGWSPDNGSKIEKSQSLYHGFSRQKKLQKYKRNNKVLYICGVLFNNITEFSNSTIESSGRFREKFEQRRHELFRIIKQNENIKIALKLHPKYRSQFPEEYALLGNVELCKSKKLNLTVLNEYKLIYCEYLSTVYIECILNDIPVVCFCDPYAYKAIEDDVIVNQLLEANIFQQDIYGALDMMKLSEEGVTSWWSSSKVEKAKLNFKKNYVSFGGLIFDQVERR